MKPSLRTLSNGLGILGLFCLSLLALSCGGGGGNGAVTANSALPVLRTYSGAVQNGAVTLTDPQSGGSVQITNSGLSNGTAVTLRVHKGTYSYLSGKVFFITAPVSYSVVLPFSRLSAAASLTFTLPELPGTVSAWRHCDLTFSPSTASMSATLATPTPQTGYVQCSETGTISQLSPADGTPLYATLVDYNTSGNTKSSRAALPASLYAFDPAKKLNVGNYLVPGTVAGKRICVLIHGLTQSATNNDIVNATQYLHNLAVTNNNVGTPLYDYILVADYDSIFGSIKENAETLSAQLAPFLQQAASCDIIGYSMGGLIARWAIEKATTPLAPYNPRLVTLATPHAGVPLRQVADLIESSLIGVTDVFPKGIAELFDDQGPYLGAFNFIGTLNAGSGKSPQLDYYTLAGTLSFNLSNIEWPLEAIISLSYYASLDPSQRANDGVVGVYSAEWSGLASRSASWGVPANRQKIKEPQTHFDVITNLQRNGYIEPFLFKGLQVTVQ